MKTKTLKNLSHFFVLLAVFCSGASFADPVIINNNSGGSGSNQPTYSCPPANQNNIYDSRIPPAGVYSTNQGTLYTTGEKKPFITDNNCNNGGSAAPVIQPYVNVPRR